MKREIKFRGIRTDNGEWCFGGIALDEQFNHAFILVKDVNGMFINTEVVPESVGQFTGLKDSELVEIYGDDLLKITFKAEDYTVRAIYHVHFDFRGISLRAVKLLEPDEIYSNITLEWDKQLCVAYASKRYDCLAIKQRYSDGQQILRYSEAIEVVGNIYQNPELLENQND